MKDFFGFERLIATTIIKVAYWIGLGAIALFGILSFIGLLFAEGSATAFLVPFGMAFAALIWRLTCELYIVVFGIHERLGAIRDAVSAKPVGQR
ncbi:DUF4282 domain-containing protein [Aureimonas psammosilenae]|uniref:DUF4282 domain-containing protein n=1 Tax=Aureimonas psammosilenae TaxID=2495496 RepID=UPI001260A663|nr:DUF4282 domain-containing protein [Aureimonas psammosilenae]